MSQMPRLHSIDLLRVLGVHAVVIGHVLRFFEVNSFGIELFNGPKASRYVNALTLFGHQWIVALLLFLAGFTSHCASMSQKSFSARAFALRRICNLAPPLLAASLLFLVPKQFLTVDECGANNKAPDSLITFYPFYLSIACLSRNGFEWLWFLVLQTILTVVHAPMLRPSTLKATSWHIGTLHVTSVVMLRLAIAALPWFTQPRGSPVPPLWSDEAYALLNSFLVFNLGVAVAKQERHLRHAWQTLPWLRLGAFASVMFLPFLVPVFDDVHGEPTYFQAAGVWATYRDRPLRVMYEAGRTYIILVLFVFARSKYRMFSLGLTCVLFLRCLSIYSHMWLSL